MFLSLYFISILGMFHMESMWNPCGMSTHGMDMEFIVVSTWFIYQNIFHMESIWNLWNISIPYGMWGDGKVNWKSGKNYRSGIFLFLGLREREGNYKYMQFEISCVAGPYKGIYSNEKLVARILGQRFVCSWAWEKVTTSMYSLR